MAPLEIIGAGFGRTGTESLRTALNMLGYNTHHMKSFWEDPDLNPDDFTNAYFHRDQADWDKIYAKYDAAVDWPTVAFYKDLLARYPNAKVLLTVRSAESWYESVKKTIHKTALAAMNASGDDRVDRFRKMATTVCLGGIFGDEEQFADKEKMKRLFLEHNEDVKKTVPAEQLLIMELGEGWPRLCNFLGKEVPKEPYPRTNSAEEFGKYFKVAQKHSMPDSPLSLE